MRYKTINFNISDDVHAIGLKGAYLAIGELKNKRSDSDFEEIKNTTVNSILSNIDEEKIKNDKILQGFRKLHDAVKRSNRKNVASPENLLKMLIRLRMLPSINLIVDIYNLISIKSGLALGAHDLSKVSGDIELRMTNGTENFHPLGAKELKPVQAGEYSYIDSANDIICRLEVRQVEKTKVALDTTECFYIIQGNMETSSEYIKSAVDDLINLTQRFCGGEVRMLYVP